MKIRDIFAIPEPQRTKLLEELSETEAIKVYSKKTFPVRYRGKIEKVKEGENAVSKNFGLFLLRKYPELSETPLSVPETKKEEAPQSDYFKKLLAVNGIGEKIAKDIEKEYPTPVELVEAAKSGHLPENLERFKDTFLEVFK